MNEQWYSIVEYARAFSISDMTVRRHIKTGKIKAFLQDGKYYIPVTRPASTQMTAEVKPNDHRKPGTDSLFPPFAAQPPMPLQVLKGAAHNAPSNIPSNIPLGLTPPVERTVIPPHISSAITGDGTPTAHTHELLDFCSKSLENFKEMERHIEQKFMHKIESLEQIIANKDLEIKGLKQTVEDLQLLVRIFEKKHT